MYVVIESRAYRMIVYPSEVIEFCGSYLKTQISIETIALYCAYKHISIVYSLLEIKSNVFHHVGVNLLPLL